jgi:hypothetical protein
MIYLDHNATTPVLPGPAGDSSFIIHHSSFSEEWGNPSRAFKFGSKLRGVIEAACARSTPVRGVSRTRERVAPGVSTVSAAPGWQGRPAFGVSRCQTGEIWRIQKCQ